MSQGITIKGTTADGMNREVLVDATGRLVVSGGGASVWGDLTGVISNQTDLQAALDAKQPTLISATNIKTINGATILGSGDMVIASGGGGGAWAVVADVSIPSTGFIQSLPVTLDLQTDQLYQIYIDCPAPSSGTVQLWINGSSGGLSYNGYKVDGGAITPGAVLNYIASSGIGYGQFVGTMTAVGGLKPSMQATLTFPGFREYHMVYWDTAWYSASLNVTEISLDTTATGIQIPPGARIRVLKKV